MIEYKLTNKLTKEVIDEILKIQKEKGLTPEQMVEFAKNKNNILHDLFEWEDSVAGDNWRLQQARVLINEIKVIIENHEYYAFENVVVSSNTQSYGSSSSDVESVREYVPIVEILSNEDLRKQIISSALNHLAYWEKQNEKYDELKPITKVASRVRKDLNKKWQKQKK